MGQLTDQRYLENVLARAGVSPRREAGQNFLVSDEVVEATLEALSAAPKQITELGAGVGTLTMALAAQGFSVRAIERDKTLAGILEKQLPKKLRERVEIVIDDLRNVDWAWPRAYHLVGNIPYNLSGLIMRRITQLAPPPESVVLLVQREVAARMAAQPPDMNRLGLAVQLWGTPTLLLRVPASCFWPPPEVESSLIFLEPFRDAAQTLAEREAVLKLAKVAFQAKRKQLGGVLKRAYKISSQEMEQWLGGAGVPAKGRPQELSVEAWQRLAETAPKTIL